MRSRLQKIVTTGLGLLLALFPFQTLWITQEWYVNGAKWEYGTLGLYATELYFFGFLIPLFSWWFIREWQKKKPRPQTPWWTRDRQMLIAWLMFLLYAASSALWSPIAALAQAHARHLMMTILLALMLAIGPLTARSAIRWLIFGAVMQACLGMAQFLWQTAWSSSLLGLAAHSPADAGASIVATATGRWLRSYGAFPHPNLFGGYLVFVLTLLVFARDLFRRRLTPFVLSLPLWTALFFTMSRSAWIAMVILLVAWYFLEKNKKNFLWGASLIGIYLGILAIMFSPLVHSRVTRDAPAETRSITERVSGYHEAKTLVAIHPWLGVGAGQYTRAAMNLTPGLPGYAYQPAHAVPLLIMAELGIVGAIFLLFALIQSARWLLSLAAGGAPLLLIAASVAAPLLLFDHYLWSLSAGLLAGAVFVGLTARFITDESSALHNSSTERFLS